MSKMWEIIHLHVLSQPIRPLFTFVNTGPVSPTPPSCVRYVFFAGGSNECMKYDFQNMIPTVKEERLGLFIHIFIYQLFEPLKKNSIPYIHMYSMYSVTNHQKWLTCKEIWCRISEGLSPPCSLRLQLKPVCWALRCSGALCVCSGRRVCECALMCVSMM